VRAEDQRDRARRVGIRLIGRRRDDRDDYGRDYHANDPDRPRAPEFPQSLIPVSSAMRTLSQPEEGAAMLAFVDRVDNPYFPLPAGAVWHYAGSKDGRRALDVMKGIAPRKTIQG